LAHAQNDGDLCMGAQCPQRCWKAHNCRHRDRDCPSL
jgi:hypothetical protein